MHVDEGAPHGAPMSARAQQARAREIKQRLWGNPKPAPITYRLSDSLWQSYGTRRPFHLPPAPEQPAPPAPHPGPLAWKRDGVWQVPFDDLRHSVCRYYGVKFVDMMSPRRDAPVVRVRQMICALAKAMTTHSFSEIGRKLGGRDHTTVLHAVRTTKSRLETDEKLAADYHNIKAMLLERYGLREEHLNDGPPTSV